METYSQLKKRVIRMYIDNISTREISKQTETPLKTINIWVKPEREKRRTRMKEDMRSLLEKGMHQAAIARELKVSQPTVYKYIQKWGFRHLVLQNNERARNEALLRKADAVQNDLKRQQSLTAYIKIKKRRMTKEANDLIRRKVWDREIYLAANRIAVDIELLLEMKSAINPGDVYWHDINVIVIDRMEKYLDSMLEPHQQGQFGGKLVAKMIASIKAMIKEKIKRNYDRVAIEHNLSSYDTILDQCRTAAKRFDRIVAANQSKILTAKRLRPHSA